MITWAASAAPTPAGPASVSTTRAQPPAGTRTAWIRAASSDGGVHGAGLGSHHARGPVRKQEKRGPPGPDVGSGAGGASSSAPWSSAEWSWSQRRTPLSDGRRRRDDDGPEPRGPWPNTRRCASSWMTTVSNARGEMRRHEKARRAWLREASLPRALVSDADGGWRYTQSPRRGETDLSCPMAARARGLSQAGGRRSSSGGLSWPGLLYRSARPSAPPIRLMQSSGGWVNGRQPQSMEVAAKLDRRAIATSTCNPLTRPGHGPV